MLTKSSKYAVRAISYLVVNSSENQKILVKDISNDLQLPKPFLSKILQRLSAKDYISSSKGRGGGFYVTEDQLDHSILDIIIEVEGKDRLKRCALDFDNCDEAHPCVIHHMIASEKGGLWKAYKEIKLKDLKS
ncbi:MAG: Rrf2 family transcriptional regulator [Bacteroidia bacterium]|nr:Rrf2 family transcriptional regulator [Bacteroidia bacterium]NNF31687.1 Rrf2 family transcriptional regulator [Flavobacteriaceae bacterium]NNJ81546.1 Rrf2 family transcriptional regulator [Flavobacteriaceae bacterium]NNK55201.1 Rrf2 family transcriptional regulator [Flavobacteriaceae bacterium]NNM10196.1 Rrf2 family transcriptional regulator [Flavobacteriaceae bacterium]